MTAPLWTPSAARREQSAVAAYLRALGRPLDYDALWQWSVTDLEGFWASIWDYYDVPGRYERVLSAEQMPGARWFAGAELNYAEHVFRHRRSHHVAIVHASETDAPREITWGELSARVAGAAAALRERGVGPGDRVAAVLPNVPEAVIAFLAGASLGAIWSCCSPDFGPRAVIDRFAQIEPKVLIAGDRHRYGGRDFDRHAELAEIAAGLPTLTATLAPAELTAPTDAPLTFTRVDTDHPLWILYSSGTTGPPKAIVHGHGGMLLEHLKALHLQLDLQAGDRFFWYTTTGWMMWNYVVAALLTPAAIVLYDGRADPEALWPLIDTAGITCFGTSAAFLSACRRAGLTPDLTSLRSLGSTGSPLAPEDYAWVYERHPDLWLYSTSGGTDICSALVGGSPLLPVHAGELQARALGAKVEAFDEHGKPLTGSVGELVVTAPMPSMPLGFWGDTDGERLRSTYFDAYPGVWRHGDWITLTERGSAIIHGRSDATINRLGIRIGTSEIYRAVLREPGVEDALVVDDGGTIRLFVVGDAAAADLRARIRAECSPRHVPDRIHRIAKVPRTLSGKPLEIPVKRILAGTPVEQAVSRDALADPSALDLFAAGAAIARGEPVILPFDTVYGLVTSPIGPEPTLRLNALKRRPADAASCLVAADVETLLALVDDLPQRVVAAIRALLPGPYTLIVPSRAFPWISGNKGATLGIRVPVATGTTAHVLEFAGALTATSANLSGAPDSLTLAAVAPELRAAATVAVDARELARGRMSTIVDLVEPAPRFLREGAASIAFTLNALKGAT